MEFKDSELHFLEHDLILRFGEEEGRRIFNRSMKLYAELVVTTDYKGSPTLEKQLKKLVYPVIAYYKTLLAYGYRQSAALGLVRYETEKAAQFSAERHAAQMRKFFPFLAFRRNFSNFIEFKFPSAEWKVTNLRKGGWKLTFRVERCLYCQIAAKFGCEELSTVFCDYERVAFAGLNPKIGAECNGSLADGHDYCEFVFTKGKKHK